MAEYNTTEFEEQEAAKNADKKTLKAVEDLPSIKEIRANQMLGRRLEEDNMRDKLLDEGTKERVEWSQPGGLKKKAEKYAPEDGKYDSGIMNVLTSNDPLGGVTDMITDEMAQDMTKVQNKGSHAITKRIMSGTLKNTHKMSDKEAKLVAEVVNSEMQYGTEALDRARSKLFRDKVESASLDNSQGPSAPF